MSLRVKLESFLHSSDYQFGFKANHSTDLCIYTLKEVIDFYKSQSGGGLLYPIAFSSRMVLDKGTFCHLCYLMFIWMP